MTSGDYDQRRAYCKPKNPCAVLRNLVDLMEHPISENVFTRHLDLLRDFLNASHYAFWLRDIPRIIRLFEVIIKRLETVPEFRKPLECLLHFSAVPPMLTKPSEMLEFARDLREYFSTLGYLILCLHEDESLCKLVLLAIIQLIERESVVGYCCVPLENIKNAVAESNLVEILAQLLHVINDELYPLLLEAILLTCEISKSTCEIMVKENAIEYLLQRLEPTWRERDPETKPNIPLAKDTIPNIEIVCCILWKLIFVIDSKNKNAETPSKFALWSLQYAFQCSNILTRNPLNRNNLIAIILKLLDTFPDLQFAETELADDIAVLAKDSRDNKSSESIQPNDAYLNFQFKKTVFACLHYYKQFNADKTIQNHHIVKHLTKFIYKERPYIKDRGEYCATVKLVLKLIPKYLQDSVDSFINFNGPANIITMTEYFTHTTYDMEVLEACLYCLHNILLLSNERLIIMVGEYGGSSICSAVCNKLLGMPALTQSHQKCVSHAFCIMRILAAAGFINDRLISKLCMNFLKRVIHPYEDDPILDQRMIICALHFLWENVTFTDSVFKEFLQNGGIYALLDIIENNSYPVKSVSLGVIADISKMFSSLPYLITWRKRGLKLVPMLLNIFRGPQEEIRCGTSEITPNNEWVALCQGRKVLFPTCCTTREAIVRNCRSRIYGILHSLKVRYKDKVQFINKFYKIYTDKLGADHEIIMLFAENFLSLSMCESWLNLSKELKAEGVTPVGSDNDHLMDSVERIQQWRRYLRLKINDIIQKEAQIEDDEEKDTYILLNEARLSDALDALNELHFLSNCTEPMFQITKRLRITIDTDTMNRTSIMNYHSTSQAFPNIYNQTINIESNVIYPRQKGPMAVSAVSLDEDESLEIQDSGENLSEQILEC